MRRILGMDVVGADVLGDVLGDDIEGDDDNVSGDEEVIVGVVAVNPRTGRRRLVKPRAGGGGSGRAAGPRLQLQPKPDWRAGQVAPGVQAPQEGMVPLPLIGQPSGTFSATVPAITFVGQVQEPYRPERLLVSLVRTGTTAAAPRVMGQLFVGTKLQQAQIAAFDIELIGTANAFGVRLSCQQVEPGVFVNLQCVLTGALTTTDTILVNSMFLGRVIQ
jgi:hypothetical protein